MKNNTPSILKTQEAVLYLTIELGHNYWGQVLILEFWGDGNGKRWKDEILTRESTAQDDAWGV